MTVTEVKEEEVKEETPTKRVMTEDHKAALAAGREQSRIVRDYLAALGTTKKRRGRQVTVESLQARLDKAVSDLSADPSPIDRLNLTQRIKDIKAQLEVKQAPAAVDISALEKEFIRVGKSYAENRGISRATFAECGVEKRVLEAAGI